MKLLSVVFGALLLCFFASLEAKAVDDARVYYDKGIKVEAGQMDKRKCNSLVYPVMD